MAVHRVLVTDAEHRASLAAIRCLSDAGYRVSAVANTPVAPGLWSRACWSRSLVPRVSLADSFLTALLERLRRERHDALIPGTDLSLYLVSRHRDRFEPYVSLGLPPHRAVERALDKRCLAVEAAAAGIATPEARVCDGCSEALAGAQEFGYPVLVKPLAAVTEVDGQLLRESSRRADDEAELREFQRELGACIVQRYVSGPVLSLAGVTTDVGMLGSVLVRHHRIWPPSAGSASFVESVAADDELSGRVQMLVEAIGWRGLWQVQFVERADGVLHAIDFNPRPYGCMGVAAAAGVPLTALWCASLLGQVPPQLQEIGMPATARPGVRWRMEDNDARNILWRLRQGRPREAWRAALPRPRTTHAYFRVRDPLPLVARGVELGLTRWRRRGGRRAARRE